MSSPERGWRKLAAGAYVAPDGALHVSIPELLEDNGYEATRQNVELLTHAWEDMARQMGAALEVHE
jgi:hypothetical protein